MTRFRGPKVVPFKGQDNQVKESETELMQDTKDTSIFSKKFELAIVFILASIALIVAIASWSIDRSIDAINTKIDSKFDALNTKFDRLNEKLDEQKEYNKLYIENEVRKKKN